MLGASHGVSVFGGGEGGGSDSLVGERKQSQNPSYVKEKKIEVPSKQMTKGLPLEDWRRFLRDYYNMEKRNEQS